MKKWGIGLKNSTNVRGYDGSHNYYYDNDPNQEILVSTAKARCSDAYILVTNEAVQMLGGIGMTDEEDTGFYMKRARAAEMTFGDATFHKDRFATLKGY